MLRGRLASPIINRWLCRRLSAKLSFSTNRRAGFAERKFIAAFWITRANLGQGEPQIVVTLYRADNTFPHHHYYVLCADGRKLTESTRAYTKIERERTFADEAALAEEVEKIVRRRVKNGWQIIGRTDSNQFVRMMRGGFQTSRRRCRQ